MGYHPTTKCREYREGRTGRIRNYKCRQCGDKFRTDLRLAPLPLDQRICPKCISDNRIAIMVTNDIGNWDSFKK